MSSPFKSSLRAGGTKRCPGASGALPAEKTACSLESIAAGPVKKKPRWSAAEKRARKVAAMRACAYCSATDVRCRGDLADPDQPHYCLNYWTSWKLMEERCRRATLGRERRARAEARDEARDPDSTRGTMLLLRHRLLALLLQHVEGVIISLVASLLLPCLRNAGIVLTPPEGKASKLLHWCGDFARLGGPPQQPLLVLARHLREHVGMPPLVPHVQLLPHQSRASFLCSI